MTQNEPIVDDFPDSPMFDLLVDPSAVVDAEGVIRRANASLVCQSGYSAEEMVGQHVTTFVPSWNPPIHRLSQSHTLVMDMLLPGRVEISVVVMLSPLAIEGGGWFIATMHANTPYAADAQAALTADAERRFSMAFEYSMAPTVLMDTAGKILSANDAFCEMLGRAREEVLGQDSAPFTHRDDLEISPGMLDQMTNASNDRARYVKRYLHADGSVVVTEVSQSAARDDAGNTLYFIVSLRDVTAEREMSERLSFQALHDPLTGLANRTLFDDRFTSALERAHRSGGNGAVMMLDLDDFKFVNDSYGHLAGDELLRQVAARLANVVRTADTLCRFGGDEFLYLAEGLASFEDTELVATRLKEALGEPFEVGELLLTQSVSIGVSLWDKYSTNQDLVVSEADAALYEAKHKGKNRQVFA